MRYYLGTGDELLLFGSITYQHEAPDTTLVFSSVFPADLPEIRLEKYSLILIMPPAEPPCHFHPLGPY
jgi:hypothetical protein